MREEKAKKDAKDRIRTIKAVIHPEVVAAGEGKSSTLVAQVAKKLLRLTLVAVLAEEGGALGQSSGHCYVTHGGFCVNGSYGFGNYLHTELCDLRRGLCHDDLAELHLATAAPD